MPTGADGGRGCRAALIPRESVARSVSWEIGGRQLPPLINRTESILRLVWRLLASAKRRRARLAARRALGGPPAPLAGSSAITELLPQDASDRARGGGREDRRRSASRQEDAGRPQRIRSGEPARQQLMPGPGGELAARRAGTRRREDRARPAGPSRAAKMLLAPAHSSGITRTVDQDHLERIFGRPR